LKILTRSGLRRAVLTLGVDHQLGVDAVGKDLTIVWRNRDERKHSALRAEHRVTGQYCMVYFVGLCTLRVTSSGEERLRECECPYCKS
jgi:hypothetical protein